MRSRASRFRQSDLTRALRGAAKAGMLVERVEIEASGRIVIFSGVPGSGGAPLNPWDEELSR
jgi:hypothetical protein